MVSHSSSNPRPALTAGDLEAFEAELGGKYEMLGLLGSGGMGRVVRARHRQLDEFVAIKFLHSDLIRPEFVPRFLREARATARIRSVHVARVRDVDVSNSGQPYIIMECLEGEDLGERVANGGPLPHEQAIGFILQALEAVGEAHSKGLIHRDIKPSNLFLTTTSRGEPCVKVLDFGLAKRISGADTLDPITTAPGALVGSPSYMSPEQFIDSDDIDARTDIWAVGVSLFELLTGVPPFRGANVAQLYAAVAHGRVARARSIVPELPPEVDAVIAKCLSRKREERYASVEELVQALAPLSRADSRPPLSAQEREDAPDVGVAIPPLQSVTPLAASWASSEHKVQALGIITRRSWHGALVAGLLSLGVVGAWTARPRTMVLPQQMPVPSSMPKMPGASGALSGSEGVGKAPVTGGDAPAIPAPTSASSPKRSRRRPPAPSASAATPVPPPAAPPESDSLYEKYP